MEKLAALMCVRLRRDEHGYECIQGREGNIHADGHGYAVAVMLPPSSRSLEKRLEQLKTFCDMRQHGDTEAVVHMSKLPTKAQATLVRSIIMAEKVRECSPITLQRLQRTAFKPGQEANKSA